MVKCEICGKEIQNPNYNQKYCSPKCRNRSSKYREYQREYKRKLRRENREEYNAYIRRWRAKNPEKVKGYDIKRSESHKQKTRNRYRERREQVAKLIGSKCVICGRSKETLLCFHEIHGKPHPRSEKKFLIYILEHPNDFLRVCRRCHGVLHTYVKHKKKFEELAGLFLN